MNPLVRIARSGDAYAMRDILKKYTLSIDTLSFLLCNISEHNDVAFAEMLINYGADINYSWNGSYTPLSYAIENLSELMIIYLIHKGADTYQRTHDDLTILHQIITAIGVQTNNIYDYTKIKYISCSHLIDLIISYPIDINAEDTGGMTALDLVNDYYIPGATELIIKHGGKPGSKKWHPSSLIEKKLELQVEVIKAIEAKSGPLHPDVATALMLLARLQDKPESSKSLARALHIRETVLGNNHPDTEFTRYVLL